MRHIVIQIENAMKYPPTLSLIKMLRDMGDDVLLFSSEINQDIQEFCKNNGSMLINLGYSYSVQNSAVSKMFKIPILNRSVKVHLKKYYDGCSLVWVMTSITLKYIGGNLRDKHYIMYMYELSQEIRYYQKISFLKVPIDKLFKNAAAVIECEYNRAHIAQAWFGLDILPYVVPNKPYMAPMNRKSLIENAECRDIINKIKSKKIILYQGVIDAERPLDPFIDAVDELGEEYAFVVMSGDSYKLKNRKSRNLVLLPFVNPPHHLEITSWAYVGILTYVPVRDVTTSPLNAVYCAPNKIFEYAMFGIPMIGNSIPGLKYSLEQNKMGVCFDDFSSIKIEKAIKTIERNYESFSGNAKSYYGIDNFSVIKKVIENYGRQRTNGFRP